jgi:hypothetical protein
MNLVNWQGTDETVNDLSSYSVKVGVPELKAMRVLQQGIWAVSWLENV